MLLFIIEIILTVSAWKKGWRGWALLPLGVGLTLAFAVGLAIGLGGGSNHDAFIPGLLIDVLMVVALGVMSGRTPKQSEFKDATVISAVAAEVTK